MHKSRNRALYAHIILGSRSLQWLYYLSEITLECTYAIKQDRSDICGQTRMFVKVTHYGAVPIPGEQSLLRNLFPRVLRLAPRNPVKVWEVTETWPLCMQLNCVCYDLWLYADMRTVSNLRGEACSGTVCPLRQCCVSLPDRSVREATLIIISRLAERYVKVTR